MQRTDLMRALGVNKVKYNVLDVEFGLAPDIIYNKESVNIHVDLNSLLDSLFTKEVNEFFDAKKMYHMTIASSILNMLAHFRAYFVYRKNLSTKIYLYYTRKNIGNVKYYSQASDTFDYKYVVPNIKKAIDIVKTIVPYCNNIHYMDLDKNDPIGCIQYTIDDICNYDKSFNLVLTKDPMMFQLVNANNPTYILRLKRDDTEIITKKNVYDYLLSKNKYKPEKVSSELLSFYYAASGLKTRDIKSTNRKTKVLQILDKAILDDTIVNERYPKVEYLLEELKDSKIKDADYIIDSYYKIDMKTIYNRLNIAHKTLLNNSIINKFDREGLRSLNQQYFTGDESLMLEELVVEVKRHNKITWG